MSARRSRVGLLVGAFAIVAVVAALAVTKVVDVGAWFGGGADAPDVEAPEAAAGGDAKNPHLAAAAKDKKAAGTGDAPEAATSGEVRLPSEAKGTAPERGGASIRGRVVDRPGGAPVDGARVRLLRPDSLFTYLHAKAAGHHDELAVETDGQGRFAFRDVLPGTGYALLVRRASPPGAAGAPPAAATRAKIDLSPREAHDAGEIALGAAGGLGGRVTGPDGTPVAGARIAVSWEVKNEVQVILTDPDTLPWIEAEAKTDADGRWTCPALEPGDKTVLVKSPAGASEVRSPISCAPGQQRTDVDFTLTGTLWFAGKVVRTSGRPLAGARVFAAAGNRAAGWTVESASDGAFRIGPLTEGSYRVGALVAGMPMRLEMQKKAPDEALRFEFPEPGAITGTVTSRTARKPVRDFRVHARFEGKQDWASQWVGGLIQKTLGATAVSSPQGEFRLDGLQPGPHRIVVEAEGYPRWESAEPVTVVEGRDVEAPPVELPDGNAVSGVVVDAAGVPIAKVRVHVVDDGAEDEVVAERISSIIDDRRLEAESTTDEAGVFRTRPLTPRKYRLVFSAPGRVSVVKAGVDVSGRPIEGMKVVMKAAGKMRVRAVSPSGAPVPWAQLVLVHETATGLEETADAQGVFELEDARPGRWLVLWRGRAARAAESLAHADAEKNASVDARLDRWRAVPGVQEVVASEGQALEVTVRLPRLVTVRGRLRGMTPIENDVYLHQVVPSGNGPWTHAPLDASGRFTVEAVEPGPVLLFFTVVGEAGEAAWKQHGPYEIRDTETFDLDVSPDAPR